MRERPVDFRLNPASPLYRGLVFAGLGQHPGALLYHDGSARKSHGTLTNFTGAGNLPVDRWLWDSTLRRWVLSLNAASDIVQLATTPASASVGGCLTVCGWIKIARVDYNGTGLFNNTGFDAGGNLTALVLGGTSASVVIMKKAVAYSMATSTSTSTLTANAWAHCAGTIVGATIQAYVNGKADGAAGTKAGAIGGNAWTIGVSTYNPGVFADMIALAGDYSVYLPYLADPANVDLRIGSTPLIQSIRRYWPVGPASGEAPPVTGNRRRRVLTAA